MISKQILADFNLSSAVVKYIQEKIFLGEYKAGERIIESKIAEELNISRAPVREAISDLKNQGLIKSVPRKGNFVVEFTDEDVKEIYDIRLLLEDSILEILINEDKLTEDDYAKLNIIVHDMVNISRREGAQLKKIIKINEKDIEFHKYLWEKSGSKRRVKILSDLFLQLRFSMIIDAKSTKNLEEGAKQHFDIIRYLQCKDLINCQRVLREHIETYRSDSN